MTLDVAVVGAPFLDLTFEGLPAMPRIGEETVARALHVAPGGTGMQALGAARLGLDTGLVAPIPCDGAGAWLRTVLAGEGVQVVCGKTDENLDPSNAPDPGGGVPVTALLSTPQGVAMATALAGAEPTREDVMGANARAIVASLGRLRLAPDGPALYAVTGTLELESVTGSVMERLASARALVVNAAEATALTGQGDPESAARTLARRVPTAVVTVGGDGAVAAHEDTLARAPAPQVEVVDATGAGDLFVAAYVWADLAGASLPDRLRWASLYASLSVRAPTAYAGAVGRRGLMAEGTARGLALPGRPDRPHGPL